MKTKDKQFDLLGPKPERSFVRVEVSVPAARAALAAFAKNRLEALDTLTRHLRESVSLALNDLLNVEMGLFLGQPEQVGNKRNGYRRREYYLKGVGCLRLDLPRDRDGRFESVVAPSHEQIDPRTRKDLALLHLAGLSNRTLSMISRRLLNIEVSKSTVSASLSLLQGEAQKWLTRPLADRYWALYVDGTNFKVQRRMTAPIEAPGSGHKKTKVWGFRGEGAALWTHPYGDCPGGQSEELVGYSPNEACR